MAEKKTGKEPRETAERPPLPEAWQRFLSAIRSEAIKQTDTPER